MDSKEFIHYRKTLNKTQRQMAQLLGTSIKAIHSYEQGWRPVPAYVERQMFFLVSRMRKNNKLKKPWEFKTGDLCWFINGTICEGTVRQNWKEKMKICRACEVFSYLL
jgi:hypothetical protein